MSSGPVDIRGCIQHRLALIPTSGKSQLIHRMPSDVVDVSYVKFCCFGVVELNCWMWCRIYVFWMCRAWNIIWLLSICQVCVCFFFSRYVFSFPPKLFGDSQQTPHDTFWFEDAGLSQPHQKEGTSRFTLGGAAREKQQQEVLGRKSNKSLKMNGWKM